MKSQIFPGFLTPSLNNQIVTWSRKYQHGWERNENWWKCQGSRESTDLFSSLLSLHSWIHIFSQQSFLLPILSCKGDKNRDKESNRGKVFHLTQLISLGGSFYFAFLVVLAQKLKSLKSDTLFLWFTFMSKLLAAHLVNHFINKSQSGRTRFIWNSKIPTTWSKDKRHLWDCLPFIYFNPLTHLLSL